MSLRRQMFIRNASRDFLLQGTTLHTLPEEEQPQRTNVPVTDLDATYEPSFNQNEAPATVDVTQQDFQNIVEVATNTDQGYKDLAQSRQDGPGRFPLVCDGPPGTPYTEITEEPKPETRKQKPVLPQLKLSFPSTSRDSSGNLPFSPILAGSRHSLRSIGVDDDPVPVLPVSPAAFLSTSTPAPNRDASMNVPLCKSIADSSVFVYNPECNMCRICHEDGSKESLISPCHCTGTMGMLHMSCLEKWLGSSKTTKCEICQFKFIVHKKPYSFRWYMSEPALRKDRMTVFKDFLITLTLCLLMLLINSLTLIFAHRLFTDGKHGPASVLIIITLGATFFFVLWIWFVCRRFLHTLHTWYERFHTLQIQQTTLQSTVPVHSHTFRKPILKLPKAFKRQKPQPGDIQPQTLNSSTYISFSLESYQSYKAAMRNPVTPAEEPLLQDTNNNEITSLECHSSSVMSVYEDEQSSVTYYQPSEPGSTVTYCSETGRLLRETGV